MKDLRIVGTHVLCHFVPSLCSRYNKYIPPSPTPVSFIFLLVTVIDQIFPDLLHLDWKYCFFLLGLSKILYSFFL